jgi:hypothetical protein
MIGGNPRQTFAQSILPSPRFLGSLSRYSQYPGNDWGAFYDVSLNRARGAASSEGGCALCHLGDANREADELVFEHERYLLTENGNPIVMNQGIVLPMADARAGPHRCALTARDVRLMIRLATGGFDGLCLRPIRDNRSFASAFPLEPAAVYVNPVAGSGRSQEHLHLNLVPASYVPLPEIRSAHWPIYGNEDGAMVYPTEGLPYRALLLRGQAAAVSENLESLVRFFAETGQPFNVVVFPRRTLGATAGSVDVLVIPRAREYSPAADQKLGGLDLMCGVLVPGDAARARITVFHRDAAFREATLDEPQFAALAERMGSRFGLSLSGLAVVACPARVALEPIGLLECPR